jgi:hypothetical protein
VSAPSTWSSSACCVILFWAIVGLLLGLRASKRTPRWPSLSTSPADLKAIRIYTTLRDATHELVAIPLIPIRASVRAMGAPVVGGLQSPWCPARIYGSGLAAKPNADCNAERAAGSTSGSIAS